MSMDRQTHGGTAQKLYAPNADFGGIIKCSSNEMLSQVGMLLNAM